MFEKPTNTAQKLMTPNQNLPIRADNSVTCTDKTKWLVTVNQLILTCDLFWCISQLIRICKKKIRKRIQVQLRVLPVNHKIKSPVYAEFAKVNRTQNKVD